MLSNVIFDCFVLKKGKGFGGIVDFFETVVDHWLVALLTACWRSGSLACDGALAGENEAEQTSAVDDVASGEREHRCRDLQLYTRSNFISHTDSRLPDLLPVGISVDRSCY